MEKTQPLNLGHHGEKSRVVWHAGTIQPYSSLWITVQRFLILNQPTPLAFMQDFAVNPSRQIFVKISFDSNGTGSAQCPLRLLRLARVLGEPIARFKWSYIGQYPRSTWPLFREFLVCPICLREGFHTVLYSLDGLVYCPVHHEKLNSFLCCLDQKISHSLRSSDFSAPGRCKCGSRFLDFPEARMPTVNRDRDQALEDVTHWLNSIGSRCWLGLKNSFASASQIDKFTQHFAKLKVPLHLPEPVAWWPPKKDSGLSAPLPIGYHKYGGPIKKSEHLCHPDRDITGYFKETARNQYEYQTIANNDFKSIKRYLLKHIAPNGRQWITKFAEASDVDGILQMIVDGGPEARLAWAVVLWWQSSVWNLSLRDWFKKHEFRNNLTDEIPFLTGQYESKQKFLLKSSDPREWIARWLNASSLISLWQAATLESDHVNTYKQVMWGRGVLGEYIIQEWSSGIDRDGHLMLCIERRVGPCFISEVRPDKKERTSRFHDLLHQRFNRVSTACIPYCLWYHSANCEWSSGPGPIPKDLSDCKRHRMLPVRLKTEFVVFPWDQNDDVQRAFVARSLNLPLATTGPTPREAVGNLRFATENYIKSVCDESFKH